VDDTELEGRIEIAHRLLIKIDDTTGFERPDIVYFNDRSLIGDFNKGVCGPVVFAMADAAKRLAQIVWIAAVHATGSYGSPDAVSMPPSSYPGSKGSYIDAAPTMVPPMEAPAVAQRVLPWLVAHASVLKARW
jgi:hypothetical protein